MRAPDTGAPAVIPSSRARRRRRLAAVLVAAGVLASGAVAAVAATPGPSAPSVVEQTRDEGAAEREQRAERSAEREHRRSGGSARPPAPSGPEFVCDPALSHGQNVSAYARSLPKGPGRGRLVSQAARSDCGKAGPGD